MDTLKLVSRDEVFFPKKDEVIVNVSTSTFSTLSISFSCVEDDTVSKSGVGSYAKEDIRTLYITIINPSYLPRFDGKFLLSRNKIFMGSTRYLLVCHMSQALDYIFVKYYLYRMIN